MKSQAQPAPLLTEKQQQNSLSTVGKSKAGHTKCVRNVLAKPFSDFWPVVDSDEDRIELQTLLQMLLQSARRVVSNEESQSLRKARGKNFKDTRNEIYRKIRENNISCQHLRKCLALGVNEVSCCLEKHELVALIITNDADPPMLTRHLGTLAAVRFVPFVVLSGLQAYTKNALGFSCLAVGLKVTASEDKIHLFSQLQSKILSVAGAISQNPFPKSGKESKESEAPKESFTVPHKVSEAHTLKDVYLTRNSRHYRVFVPGKGLNTESVSVQPQFLSLCPLDSQSGVMDGLQAPPKSFQPPLGSDHALNRSSHQNMRVETLQSQTILTPLHRPESIKRCSTSEKESHLVAAKVHKQKPVSRYFDNGLSSLKIKKVQSNPNKLKKKNQKINQP